MTSMEVKMCSGKICQMIQSSSTYDNNTDIENADKEYTFMIFNNYINKYK